jgi:hypothetical protein
MPTEAAFAFIGGVRDREMKQNLIIGDERPQEALNQAMRLEAAKAAAWPPSRMRKMTRVPTGTPTTPPDRRQNERPLCWQCRKPGHFLRDSRQRPCEIRDQASVVCWRCGKPGHFRRYCRHRPPEKMDHYPRARRPSESSTPPPPNRFILTVLAKWIGQPDC